MSLLQDPGFNPHLYALHTGQVTPASVLKLSAQAAMMGLRVALPCSITNIHSDQLVDVQPLLQILPYSTGQITTLTPIPHVPVMVPAGQDYMIRVPMQVGDTGLCIMADRSIDAWLETGGIVFPDDTRCHDINDAVFVPGLLSKPNHTHDTTTDLTITNGSAQIRLEKSGKFRVVNTATGGQELVDLVSQLTSIIIGLTQTLMQAQTITLAGPQPLWAATQSDLVQALQKAQTLLSNINSIEGK